MPFEQPHPSRPAPLLRALQTRGPVHRVRTRVGDDRLGRADPEPDRAARANDSAVYGGRPQDNHDTERADRAWFRDLLRPFFTAPRMRALRPRVRKLVDELLDVAELRRAHGGAFGDDVVASVAAMILFAGTETTVTQLGYGALLLLTNPDQRQAIVAAPQRLTAAVEECLRAGNAGVNAGGNGIPYR